MSLGTLIGTTETRAILPVGLVKALKLDVKVESKGGADHLHNFPLQKVPCFIGNDGFKIHEAIAIIYYLIKLDNPESSLLGKTLEEKSLVFQYMSFATSDFMHSCGKVLKPLLGRIPYNKKIVDENKRRVDFYVSLLEERLIDHEYLVGDYLTAADLFFATCFYRPITLWFGTEWRKIHPIFVRWFTKIIKTQYLTHFFSTIEFVEKPVSA